MANNYNMRRLSIAVFTALLSVTASQAYDYDFEVDGIYYNITSETNFEVEVTWEGWSVGTGSYSGDVVIPTTVTYGNTYSVTSIGAMAFTYCYSLTSVEIPNSVTSIGDNAFIYCYSLTSVEIPNSVTSIGDGAFSSCYGLTSVEIPSSVTSIGDNAFYYCYGLTSVEIPSSVTSIGYCAFSGCTSLTSIVVDEENEYYCSSDGVLFDKDMYTLICFPTGKTYENYIFPETVTIIGDYAFAYFDGLTSVEIPNNFTSIGDYAFYNCTSLTSVEIGKGVTSIGNYAFRGCTSLWCIEVDEENEYYCSSDGVLFDKYKNYLICYPAGKTDEESYTIPATVTTIAVGAFYGCTSLTSVEIGNGVTSIGERAFYNCTSLTSVEIGNGVTSIESRAFEGCTGLTDVYSLNVTPPTCEVGIYSSSTYEDATLHVPTSSVEDYKNADIWCKFANIVGLDSYTVTIYISGEEVINVGDEITISASIGGLLEEYATTDTIYAWYMNVDGGEAERIDGSTTDTLVYTPSEAGTYSFYCGVTLNDTTVYSDTTEVEVVAKGSDGSDTGIASIEAEADVTYDVYSIDGIRRMTTRERSEVESLPEGLYIVNGRKIVIRR